MFIFFSIAKLENNSIGPDLIVWATPITDIICSLVAVILFYGYVKHNGKNAPNTMVKMHPLLISKKNCHL